MEDILGIISVIPSSNVEMYDKDKNDGSVLSNVINWYWMFRLKIFAHSSFYPVVYFCYVKAFLLEYKRQKEKSLLSYRALAQNKIR